MSPIKVSRGKILDDESMRIALRLAFDSASLKTKEGVTFAAILAVLATVENPIPRYQRRSAKSDYLTLEIDGVEKARSYMLENIADTSLKTLEEKYTTIKTKVAAGIVVKAITAVIAGKVAQEIAKSSKKTTGLQGGLPKGVSASAFLKAMTSKTKDLKLDKKTQELLRTLVEETKEMMDQ